MSLVKDIFSKIDSGQAQMKPKWYFVLQKIFLGLGILFSILLALYVSSFILFSLRQAGLFLIPGFGLGGLRFFVWSLPWILIMCLIVFIVMSEWLVKKYSFAYRQPLIVSIGLIICLLLLGNILVSNLGLHNNFNQLAGRGRLPVAGPMYKYYGEPKNIHLGQLTRNIPGGFEMENRRHEDLLVLVTANTLFPTGRDIPIGARVAVFGLRDKDTIEAFGVKKILPNMRFAPPEW